MVNLAILGGEEEGDVAKLCKVAQLLQFLAVIRVELRAVAPRKLFEGIGVVAPPLTQLRTGRDILEPVLIREAILGHATGPELIDEHRYPTRFLVTPNNVMYLGRVNHGSQVRR